MYNLHEGFISFFHLHTHTHKITQIDKCTATHTFFFCIYTLLVVSFSMCCRCVWRFFVLFVCKEREKKISPLNTVLLLLLLSTKCCAVLHEHTYRQTGKYIENHTSTNGEKKNYILKSNVLVVCTVCVCVMATASGVVTNFIITLHLLYSFFFNVLLLMFYKIYCSRLRLKGNYTNFIISLLLFSLLFSLLFLIRRLFWFQCRKMRS